MYLRLHTTFRRTRFSIVCAGNPTSTGPWKVRISTASRGIKYRGTWGDRHIITACTIIINITVSIETSVSDGERDASSGADGDAASTTQRSFDERQLTARRHRADTDTQLAARVTARRVHPTCTSHENTASLTAPRRHRAPSRGRCHCDGKVFPYSLPSVGPGADPAVQAVSPQVT